MKEVRATNLQSSPYLRGFDLRVFVHCTCVRVLFHWKFMADIIDRAKGLVRDFMNTGFGGLFIIILVVMVNFHA